MIEPKYPSILNIKSYKAGLSSLESGETQRKNIKLSSNENPFGASKLSKQAFSESVETLHRYPDASYTSIKNALAEKHNINPQNIICAPGSDGIISLVCNTYAGYGDEVLYSKYSFIMYSIATMAAGATPVATPVDKDFNVDIDFLIKRTSNKSKIIFIANPNNPTGNYLPYEKIKYISQNIPKETLLVIDLAYSEYLDNNDFKKYLKLVTDNKNIIITCTFSKIYALSALRIGWCYCSNEVCNTLSKIKKPFNVSTPAVNAAIAALKDSDHIKQSKEHNSKWLKIMKERITELGIKTYPSFGNFYLAKFPENPGSTAREAFKFLANKGIMTRTLDEYDLSSYLRITIGLEEENLLLLNELKNFIEKN